jgi:hypothetical protein
MVAAPHPDRCYLGDYSLNASVFPVFYSGGFFIVKGVP